MPKRKICIRFLSYAAVFIFFIAHVFAIEPSYDSGYRFASWICTDGKFGQLGSENTCNSADFWYKTATDFCKKCNERRCEVASFKVSSSCSNSSCGDGICLNPESTQSCPQDCCPKISPPQKKDGCTYTPKFNDRCIAGYDENCSLTASCSPSSFSANTGQEIIWSSKVSGGNEDYTYSWSGTDGLDGTSESVSKTYGSPGIKSASLKVTSGDKVKTMDCKGTLSVSIAQGQKMVYCRKSDFACANTSLSYTDLSLCETNLGIFLPGLTSGKCFRDVSSCSASCIPPPAQQMVYCRSNDNLCTNTSLKYTETSMCETNLNLFLPGQTTGKCFRSSSSCMAECKEKPSPCGRWDTNVVANYPVWGTWMFLGSDLCVMKTTLQEFHRIGGKAVLQFGPGVTYWQWSNVDVSSSEQDILNSCIDNGQKCTDKALIDLKAKNPLNSIKYGLMDGWFGVQDNTKLISCPELDKKIVVTLQDGQQRTFWRSYLPHSMGQNPCDFTKGAEYDVLLTYVDGKDPKDSRETTLQVADELDMEIYLGMPLFPQKHPPNSWDLEFELQPAYLEWTKRVFMDWAVRYGNHASFKGMYQSYEFPLIDQPFYDPHINLFSQVATIRDTILPGKKIIESPYISTNRFVNEQNTIANVVGGFKRMARGRVDIIAPQDGRGVGSTALYWDYQKNSKIKDVDPRLAAYPDAIQGTASGVNGDKTFAEHFHGSVKDIFNALGQAVLELKNEGVNVALWDNVEAFESAKRDDGQVETYCDAGFQADVRTTKPRLDWAISQSGANPSRIISFMWDGFYTCTNAAHPTSLVDEIASDGNRPIVTESFFSGNTITIRGYNIGALGTKFVVTWYDSSWQAKSDTILATSSNLNWGSLNSRSPTLQEVSIPFSHSSLAPNFYIYILAKGSTGLDSNNVYSMKY